MFSPAPPRGASSSPPSLRSGGCCSHPLPMRPPGGSLPFAYLLARCLLAAYSPPPHPGARAVALPPCGRGLLLPPLARASPLWGVSQTSGDEFPPNSLLRLFPHRMKSDEEKGAQRLIGGVPRLLAALVNQLVFSHLR